MGDSKTKIDFDLAKVYTDLAKKQIPDYK